ncbi:hypothetical protein [Anaeromassilibacillus senegalensis]|uniref:hypothetical protein n=1 Tax=Anaeromassilibacillus senegalensis TaxID=1673717 RepID=UPI0012B5A0FC|nr:hypothetical protein [Anaeromassilibacillus senegalensis]
MVAAIFPAPKIETLKRSIFILLYVTTGPMAMPLFFRNRSGWLHPLFHPDKPYTGSALPSALFIKSIISHHTVKKNLSRPFHTPGTVGFLSIETKYLWIPRFTDKENSILRYCSIGFVFLLIKGISLCAPSYFLA